jgi:hypothetical protein
LKLTCDHWGNPFDDHAEGEEYWGVEGDQNRQALEILYIGGLWGRERDRYLSPLLVE